MSLKEKVESANSLILGRLPQGFKPRVGVTLGTGLSGLAHKLTVLERIPYSEIPGMPVSTVESHESALILGRLGGVDVAALAGRFHLYEGYSPEEVTLPVRVLAELGVEIMIFSNAAGGLDLSWKPASVMLITDHINLTGRNPLTGPNVDEWGERFPDMSRAYDRDLLELARRTAREMGIGLYEGVYAGLTGPSLETPAETRMLGIIGAQAVGMSTVLEVIAARHHGLRVLGFSAISNINDPDDMQEIPLDMVIAQAGKAGEDLVRLVAGILEML